MKSQRKSPMSRGRRPVAKGYYNQLRAPADGWEIHIYNKTKGWLNFKLIHPEPIRQRANFWMAYNWRQDRFTNNSDYEYLIADSFPGARRLLHATHAVFLDFRESLTDMRGVETATTIGDLM